MAPSTTTTTTPKAIFFFDIDNCLYPKSSGVSTMMSDLIDRYFEQNLHLTAADAAHLHQKYYKDYGLAIEGLVRHHKIDPLAYNAQVDDALDLDAVIRPNPALRALLRDFDRDRVRLWLFTNAYVTHGRRVVRLLGVDDQFDGITFSDYASTPLLCKPAKEMFDKAEREAGAVAGDGGQEIYFVDDSKLNCAAAQARGWHTVQKIEPEDAEPVPRVCKHVIRDHGELRALFPHLFRKSTAEAEEAEEEEKMMAS